MKEIVLKQDYGTAKKGSVYVQGLHDTPIYYKDTHKREDFYWAKGGNRDDNKFLMEQWLRQ